jgi:hypothetical protein
MTYTLHQKFLERETGIEPATNSLEGCDSTTELLPLKTSHQLSAVSPQLKTLAPAADFHSLEPYHPFHGADDQD